MLIYQLVNQFLFQIKFIQIKLAISLTLKKLLNLNNKNFEFKFHQ